MSNPCGKGSAPLCHPCARCCFAGGGHVWHCAEEYPVDHGVGTSAPPDNHFRNRWYADQQVCPRYLNELIHVLSAFKFRLHVCYCHLFLTVILLLLECSFHAQCWSCWGAPLFWKALEPLFTLFLNNWFLSAFLSGGCRSSWLAVSSSCCL